MLNCPFADFIGSQKTVGVYGNDIIGPGGDTPTNESELGPEIPGMTAEGGDTYYQYPWTPPYHPSKTIENPILPTDPSVYNTKDDPPAPAPVQPPYQVAPTPKGPIGPTPSPIQPKSSGSSGFLGIPLWGWGLVAAGVAVTTGMVKL